jgi:hypothetical protein
MRPTFFSCLSCFSWQSYALAGLCAADFISTVWLCNTHGAAEANPLMAYFLAQGVAVFAAAKFVLTAVPITILEWARRVRPSLGLIALNTAVLGYITLYGAGLAHINRGPDVVEAARAINEDPRYVAALAENRRRVEARRLSIVAASAPRDEIESGRSTNSGCELSAGKSLPSAPAAGTGSLTLPTVAQY